MINILFQKWIKEKSIIQWIRTPDLWHCCWCPTHIFVGTIIAVVFSITHPVFRNTCVVRLASEFTNLASMFTVIFVFPGPTVRLAIAYPRSRNTLRVGAFEISLRTLRSQTCFKSKTFSWKEWFVMSYI